MVGIKHDKGKAKLSLVNRETLVGIAKAMEYGALKYGKNNYKKGMEWTRVIDALLRHTYALSSGEDLDPESGLPHSYHMGACCNMLIYLMENKVGEDDR